MKQSSYIRLQAKNKAKKVTSFTNKTQVAH